MYDTHNYAVVGSSLVFRAVIGKTCIGVTRIIRLCLLLWEQMGTTMNHVTNLIDKLSHMMLLIWMFWWMPKIESWKNKSSAHDVIKT
jgi:hypothetical protein